MKRDVRLPAHVSPERYQLMLRPNFGDFTFYGEETIDLKIDKPSKEITMHSDELKVDSADFINKVILINLWICISVCKITDMNI